MGLPLGPTLANTFLVYFERNWLQTCPSDFKPHYYRRYADDIFALFTSPEHLEAFRNFLNGRYANILFTIENEKQNKILFLMYRYLLNIEHLPLLSTVNLPLMEFINILTALPSIYKSGTVYIIVYWCFHKWSSWTKLQTELVCLKEFSLTNGFPENFIYVLKGLWITCM